MIERASRYLGVLSDAIRTGALLLIALMFTGVGVMLATAGRPEAMIPLLLGAGAIFQLPKRFANLYRDLTRNY